MELEACLGQGALLVFELCRRHRSQEGGGQLLGGGRVEEVAQDLHVAIGLKPQELGVKLVVKLRGSPERFGRPSGERWARRVAPAQSRAAGTAPNRGTGVPQGSRSCKRRGAGGAAIRPIHCRDRRRAASAQACQIGPGLDHRRSGDQVGRRVRPDLIGVDPPARQMVRTHQSRSRATAEDDLCELAPTTEG